MIHKIFKKHANFRGPVAYVLRPDRGYMLESTTVPGASIDQIVEDFRSYCHLNSRVEKPVFHCALNLAPGESLSDDEWRAVARTYLRKLGFEESAHLIVKHTNREHEHIHIVASRIDAAGRCVSDRNDYARGEEIVRALEHEFGLSSVRASVESPRHGLSADEVHAALSSNTPNLRFELQQEISRALECQRSFSHLVSHLEARGVSIQLHAGADGRPRGISFGIDAHWYSGSELGRGFTWSSLMRRLPVSDADQAAIGRLLQGAPIAAAPFRPLRPLIDQAIREDSTLPGFVRKLRSEHVEVILHLAPAGTPRGISFRQADHTFTGTELGRSYTLSGLVRRGLVIDSREDASLVRSLAKSQNVSHAKHLSATDHSTNSPDAVSMHNEPAASRKPEQTAWSDAALEALKSRLAKLRPSRASRRDLSSALYYLRAAPATALRGAADARYLLAALTQPKVAARFLLAHIDAARPLNEALAFVGALRSPSAALMYSLRVTSRAARSLSKRLQQTDPLARRLAHAYASAALIDAPPPIVWARRLSEAGLSLEADSGRLSIRLADQLIPSHQLGAEMRRHLGGSSFASELSVGLRRPDLILAHGIVEHSGTLGAPRRAAAPGAGHHAPARDTSPSVEPGQPGQHSAESPHISLVGNSAGLDGAAPSARHAHHPAPDLVSTAHGADLPARPAMRAVAAPFASGGSTEADLAVGISRSTAVKHVEALGYVDLRIERPGTAPQFLAGISPVGFRSMQPTLEEQGAAIFVHARNAQLIREVPINLVAEASKRGFEPAAAVMTRPGFCDIWMHHGNYTDADPRIALFLKRSICMEYSASLERSASYGKLAMRPDELIVATGQSFSQSGELRKFFGFHLSEQRKTFEGACRAVGVPPLAEFRRAHGFASTPALDSMWMQIALKAGVPTDQALANIACDGARSLALSPRASVQYAVRILEQGLRSARGLSGRALAAAVLNSIATAASISVKALRIAGVALALVSGRRVGH